MALLIFIALVAVAVYTYVETPTVYFDFKTGECAWVEPSSYGCDTVQPPYDRQPANPGGFR